MRNPTKFGSPKLASLRYEFLKHAFKSRKINKKIKTSHRLIAEACGQRDPPVSETRTGDSADRRELADGEVSDSSVFTVAFPVIPRTQWYPSLDRRCTGAPSPVVMVDGGGSVAVRRCSPAAVCSGEVRYVFTVT